MWYRFEKGNPIGIPRIKKYQVACYNMNDNGDCFDEMFFKPDEINLAITYVETIEDEYNCDRFRVFAIFDNDDVYEVKLEKTGRRNSNFYGNRKPSKKEIVIRWFCAIWRSLVNKFIGG